MSVSPKEYVGPNRLTQIFQLMNGEFANSSDIANIYNGFISGGNYNGKDTTITFTRNATSGDVESIVEENDDMRHTITFIKTSATTVVVGKFLNKEDPTTLSVERTTINKSTGNMTVTYSTEVVT